MQHIRARHLPGHAQTPTRRLCAIAFGAIAFGSALFAPNAHCADETSLVEEQIVVSASRLHRTDQPVIVAEYDRSGPISPADLLRGMPGVAVSQAGNRGALTQVRIRGAEANHVMVLVDGISANDPALGSELNFGSLHRAGAARVEVLAGPQSAVWGSDALAGVIHIDTSPRESTTSAYLGFGSQGLIDTAIDLARVSERGHVGFSFGDTSTDGTNVSLAGSEDDAWDAQAYNLNVRRAFDNWTLDIRARHTDSLNDFDPSPFPDFVPIDGDRQTDTKRSLYRISVTRAGRWAPTLSLTGSRSSVQNLAEGLRTDDTIGRRMRVTFINNIDLNDAHELNLTLEHTVEELTQHGTASTFGDPNQHQRVDSSGYAAEYRVEHDRMRGSISMRHDVNDVFDDATTFRVGAAVDLLGGTWFTHVGTGAKNPTFTERFGFTPDTFIGNPNLQPETSLQYQMGVRFGPLTVTYFDATLDNEIDGFVFDSTSSSFTAANIEGESRRSGIETQISGDFGRVSAGGSYSYIDSKASGEREIRRPRHLARLWLTSRLTDQWHIDLSASHNGEQIDNDFSTFPATVRSLDAYQLVNATVTFEPSARVRFSLRLENALDTDYQDLFGYRSPGLLAIGGIDVHL